MPTNRVSGWRLIGGPAIRAVACAIAIAGVGGCEIPGEPVQRPTPPKVAQPEPQRYPSPVPRPAQPPPDLARAPAPRGGAEGERPVVQRPRPAGGHVVRPGEDLYGIAATYGIDAYALATANGLSPPFSVTPGQTLTLPPLADVAQAGGGAPTSLDRPAASPPAATAESGEEVAIATPVPRSPGEAPAADESGFIWPVNGDVISDFGAKGDGLFNDGINIAASRGTPVRATDGGVVAYAGNELRGFGNMLLIKHPDGWVSAYAHTEELLVQRGERVGKGQVIARVGSTGSVSRPQLHFELRKGKKAVDPLQYLRRPNA